MSAADARFPGTSALFAAAEARITDRRGDRNAALPMSIGVAPSAHARGHWSPQRVSGRAAQDQNLRRPSAPPGRRRTVVQAFRDLDRVVAVHVADVLEVVDVDQQQRALGCRLLCPLRHHRLEVKRFARFISGSRSLCACSYVARGRRRFVRARAGRASR
jgi:hypothetical protein